MAVLINLQNIEYKVIIDFTDSGEIIDDAYDWSDIYAKVNAKHEDINRKKLFPIGPGFAIKINNLLRTTTICICNLTKAWSRIPNKKDFIKNYYNNFKNRLFLNQYMNNIEIRKYIFFVSNIWVRTPKVNLFRNNFLIACNELQDITADAGFSPRDDNSTINGIEIVRKKSLSILEYTEGFKKSSVVFNTPSVLECHGWKHGEYCAMSKAIISTPLSRVMPGNFKPNEHYLPTDGTIEDLKIKIKLLIDNEELRQKLKSNINQYFCDYLTPKIVISRIIANLTK
jgi:hypothetical protein